MLDPAIMWIIGTVIVLLPFVLTYVFHSRNQSDSRGRRVNRRWQGHSLIE
ncbi:hypothetical protein [Euzebya tangerina]|nr:hypothetical protein [Euzebya tangerina]